MKELLNVFAGMFAFATLSILLGCWVGLSVMVAVKALRIFCSYINL